jgi:hypothetical protein
MNRVETTNMSTKELLERAELQLRVLIAEGGDPRAIEIARDDAAVFEAMLAAEKKGGAIRE